MVTAVCDCMSVRTLKGDIILDHPREPLSSLCCAEQAGDFQSLPPEAQFSPAKELPVSEPGLPGFLSLTTMLWVCPPPLGKT